MAQVILLGTGAAFSDATREHTYLVVKGEREAILVDCAGGPVQRLERAGVPLEMLQHIILTHHHPDHIYGLSVLLLDLWIVGRAQPLHLYGLPETLRAVRKIMAAFEWQRWLAVRPFPLQFHTISNRVHGATIRTAEFSITTAPTKHLLPTLGVRIASNASGKVIAYSSDTEVCPAVVDLARDVDVLLHEASEISKTRTGHTSAVDAGWQATRARAKKLVLVHLPPHLDVDAMRAAAQKTFQGRVIIGKDFARVTF